VSGLIKEYLISRVIPGVVPGEFDPESSVDMKAFVDRNWSNFYTDPRLAWDSCIAIVPSVTMDVFLSIEPDVLSQVQSINIKIVPK
jgi:hypothetical protein